MTKASRIQSKSRATYAIRRGGQVDVRRPDPANRDVPRGATLSSNRDLRARPQIGPDNANNHANPFDFEALTLKTLVQTDWPNVLQLGKAKRASGSALEGSRFYEKVVKVKADVAAAFSVKVTGRLLSSG